MIIGLIFLVFFHCCHAVLLPAIIAGLLLLGLQAIHGRLIQILYRIDQVLIRLVLAPFKVLPYAGIG